MPSFYHTADTPYETSKLSAACRAIRTSSDARCRRIGQDPGRIQFCPRRNELAYTITVTNESHQPRQVQITQLAPPLLQEVRWQRETNWKSVFSEAEVNDLTGTTTRVEGSRWYHSTSNIGDIKGDGFDDFLNGSHLAFAPTTTTLQTGLGDVQDTIDLPVGAYARYSVTGTVPPHLSSDADFSLAVAPDNTRQEITPENNYVSQTILIQPMADVDADGVVSFSDFLILSSNFGKQNAGWQDGDVDGDGTVGFSDFIILQSIYGKSN